MKNNNYFNNNIYQSKNNRGRSEQRADWNGAERSDKSKANTIPNYKEITSGEQRLEKCSSFWCTKCTVYGT